MISFGGLEFLSDGQGGVSINVRHNATDNSEVVRSVLVPAEKWAEIVNDVRPAQKERIEDVIDSELAKGAGTSTASDQTNLQNPMNGTGSVVETKVNEGEKGEQGE